MSGPFDEIRAGLASESTPERQAEMEQLAAVSAEVERMTAIEILAIVKGAANEEADDHACAALNALAAAICERFGLP